MYLMLIVNENILLNILLFNTLNNNLFILSKLII